MKYVVDIDGTICTTEGSDYPNSKPIVERIEYINKLFDEGHEIEYNTARGMSSGKDWQDLTIRQLMSWGVKFNVVTFGKSSYDVWIDDKARNSEEFFSEVDNRT